MSATVIGTGNKRWCIATAGVAAAAAMAANIGIPSDPLGVFARHWAFAGEVGVAALTMLLGMGLVIAVAMAACMVFVGFCTLVGYALSVATGSSRHEYRDWNERLPIHATAGMVVLAVAALTALAAWMQHASEASLSVMAGTLAASLVTAACVAKSAAMNGRPLAVRMLAAWAAFSIVSIVISLPSLPSSVLN